MGRPECRVPFGQTDFSEIGGAEKESAVRRENGKCVHIRSGYSYEVYSFGQQLSYVDFGLSTQRLVNLFCPSRNGQAVEHPNHNYTAGLILLINWGRH